MIEVMVTPHRWDVERFFLWISMGYIYIYIYWLVVTVTMEFYDFPFSWEESS